MSNPYVELARKSLETYVVEGKKIKAPKDLPREMLTQQGGVFVSIKIDGQLRGCIGTIAPTQENLAQEIIENAISAGCRDPRFYPVNERELKDLEYSVDVLKEPEPVKSLDELNPKKYGVIVQQGIRKGLLLPNLEGIDTPQEQVYIACQKAGIDPKSDFEMQRFEVIRYKEDPQE